MTDLSVKNTSTLRAEPVIFVWESSSSSSSSSFSRGLNVR